MNLGDMGAEIIKIERPGSGDDTRGWGPPFAGTEAAYFLGVNRNKRSVTLDIKDPRGLGILKKLITSADVLIENFKPGTLDRWGISSEWLERNAPRVIHCQITGYGERGPKGGMPGYDFLPHYQMIPSGEGEELRMHSVDEGESETVILCLHGEPTWSYLYRKMIPLFVAAGFRAVAPDLVGFGRSDKPADRKDYTYQRHVDWMTEFLDAVDLRHITLVGQDWGGLIGLRLGLDPRPAQRVPVIFFNDFFDAETENFKSVFRRLKPDYLDAMRADIQP